MPDYYYQIKGRNPSHVEDGVAWAWPPVFSGQVTANDRKAAKELIEEDYGRQFPLRVLRKDIAEHAYLLHMQEISPTDDYIRRRFRETACKECLAIFRPIDKYNDPNADDKSPHYCSAHCARAGKLNEVRDFKLVSEGKLPAVIYQVVQLSTGKTYVGQTTQAFTLRWWQHLTNPTDCKFHSALKDSAITDWQFAVVEIIAPPADCKNLAAYITDRERHWIEKLNSIIGGYNTIRPTGINPQQCFALEDDNSAF